MDRCDLARDYIEEHRCRENWWENTIFDIDALLKEEAWTKWSDIETETIKTEALNSLNDSELKRLRDYLIDLSNQKWRDDRLQLRELSLKLYRHQNNPNEWYYNNIETYRDNITFNIRSWHINLDFIWWFADWKYTLSNYDISPISIEENIYNLDLEFQLKRKWLTYRQTKHLEFKYEKYKWEIIIKYDWNYYRIPTIYKNHGNNWKDKNNHKHRKDSNSIQPLNIKIWNLSMKVLFKAD